MLLNNHHCKIINIIFFNVVMNINNNMDGGYIGKGKTRPYGRNQVWA